MCVLLPLQDLVCSSSVEVAWKVLMTLKIFLESDDHVLVCDLLRSQFLQILQQVLVQSNSASLQGDCPLWLGCALRSTSRVDGWRDALWDKEFLKCWYNFCMYLREEIYGQDCTDIVSFSRDPYFELRKYFSNSGYSGFKLWLLNQGQVLLYCLKCSSGELLSWFKPWL